jgi:hypothetical protein
LASSILLSPLSVSSRERDTPSLILSCSGIREDGGVGAVAPGGEFVGYDEPGLVVWANATGAKHVQSAITATLAINFLVVMRRSPRFGTQR